MRFIYAYQTDKGTTRSNNQDSLIVKSISVGKSNVLLAAVCDGVGGLKFGERTSRRAAELLGAWADYELPQILKQEQAEKLLRHRFRQLIQDINEEIFFGNQRCGISSGTTLTAMLLWEYRYLIAHVGDSRIYAIDRQVWQLTADHSWVAQEEEAGRLTKEEARNHENRNVLLTCIGASADLVPQLREGEIKESTVFLLCTDGFWHCIEEPEWMRYFSPEQIMKEHTLGEHLYSLIDQVKRRGEKDNITAIGIGVF